MSHGRPPRAQGARGHARVVFRFTSANGKIVGIDPMSSETTGESMALEFRSLCPLIQVFDMPTSLAFYRDTIGMELVQTAPLADQVTGDDFDWVWLRRDDADLMLNTAYDPDAERPASPEPARVAAHDDTALFIGCPDVDGMYQHLRAKGLAVEPPTIAPYGMKQLSVKDPDGFTVCFQWRVAT